MEFRSRLTDDFPDNRATVKPPDVYDTSTFVPKHITQVVASENFNLIDDFKLNYEELKDVPMTFEEPLNYQTMARSGIVQSGQEDVSTSENDNTSTISLEQDGVIYMEVINCSEQLKVSMCMQRVATFVST